MWAFVCEMEDNKYLDFFNRTFNAREIYFGSKFLKTLKIFSPLCSNFEARCSVQALSFARRNFLGEFHANLILSIKCFWINRYWFALVWKLMLVQFLGRQETSEREILLPQNSASNHKENRTICTLRDDRGRTLCNNPNRNSDFGPIDWRALL